MELHPLGAMGSWGCAERCPEPVGRRQGVQGVWRAALALGVQRGRASFGPADGPWRVREGGAHPERRVSAAGVRGRQPPANDSWNAGPKGRSAS